MFQTEKSLQGAIEQLYSDHRGWLYGWLRRKLGCAHHAEDLTQDTFLKVMLSRDALSGMRTPKAFLTTTAQHLLIDRARRQMIEQRYLAELAAMAESCPGYPSPEQILETLQALELISIMLESLPPRPRQAFLMHYLEDMPQSTIAEALGVSTRMVRKYLVQALLHCQTAFPDHA